MSLLQVIFGNVFNFRKQVNSWAETKSVNEFYEVFYKAFFESLEEYKKQCPQHLISNIKEVEYIYRLPDSRKEFMNFFKVEIDNVSSFRELIVNDINIDKLSSVLIEIAERKNKIIDLEFSKKIIPVVLECFQKNILNALSNDQTLTTILLQEFESRNIVGELKQKLEIQAFQSNVIIETQEQTQKILLNHASDTNKKLDSILTSINTDNDELEKRYIDKFLLPIFKEDFNQAKSLLKERKPQEALTILKKIIKNSEGKEIANSFLALVHLNIGHSYSQLQDQALESKYYIKAIELNPDDVDLLYNAVNAYTYLGQKDKVIEITEKITSIAPESNKRYALMLLSENEENSIIEEVIKRIPVAHLESIEVLLALSYIYGNKKNKEKQLKYIRKAVKFEPEHAQIKRILAYNLSEKYINKFGAIVKAPLTKKSIKELKEAANLYKDLWNKNKTTPIAIFRTDDLLNVSAIYSRLGEKRKALRIINECLEVVPNNDYVKYHKVLYLYDINEHKQATEIALSINLDTIPDLYLILAQLLYNSGDKSKAIQLINQFIYKYPSSHNIQNAKFTLISILIDTKELKHAERELKSFQKVYPHEICIKILNAKLQGAKKGDNAEVESLDNILPLLSKDTNKRDLYDMAESYYILKQWYKAIGIYNLLLSGIEDNSVTSHLIDSYLNIAEWNKASELCQKIREKFGFIAKYAERELYALQMSRNFESALVLCKILRKEIPNSNYFQIQLAQINLALGNTTKANKLLCNLDIKSLKLQELEGITASLIQIGNFEQVLNSAYYYRRHFDTSEAHAHYWKIFMNFDKEIEKFCTSPVNIFQDIAVTIEVDSGNISKTFIIEQKKKKELKRNEINLSDSLYKKIRAKKIGDSFVWSKNFAENKIAKITSIKTKWLFAFHETLEMFDTRFVETSPFQSFQGSKEKIFKIVDKQLESQKLINDFYEVTKKPYRDGLIPLGAIAEKLRINPIKIFEKYRLSKELGIKCAGAGDSLEAIKVYLNRTPQIKVATDVFGLMSLFSFDLHNKVIECFGKIRICQSTRDEFQNILSELNFSKGKSSMSIVVKDGEKFKKETSEEELSKSIDYFQEKINWINENCIIMPFVSPKKKKKIRRHYQTYGKSSFETLLICKQHNCVLFSDNYPLRIVLKNDYKIEGFWSQSLLYYLVDKQKLSPIDYHNKLIELIVSNYHFISFNQFTLLAASEKSLEYFERVSEEFKAPNCTMESAITCGIQFLISLWLSPEKNEKKNRILTALTLLGLTRGRNVKEVLSYILGTLYQPQFSDLVHPRLKLAIREWIKIQCSY